MSRRFLAVALAVLSTLWFSTRASAQCPSVRITPYGVTCPFFGQHATLTGSYDSGSCLLSLSLTRSATCCNTFARLQVLVFGVAGFDPGFRHPLLVPGCLLSVSSDVLISLAPTSVGQLQLTVPRVPAPISVFVQGINDYFTTIGLTHDFQTSDALRLDIG